ncbi:MAG: peptidase S1 [Pseudomonadota bacterium]
MIKQTSIAIAALAVAMSGTAVAQDIFGEPISGTVVLDANFEDDPDLTSLISGGMIDASEAAEGCAGYISDDPDLRLSFTGSGASSAYPLYISVESDEDTTLVINAPDGKWYCNDDGGEGNNPLVVFGPAQSGNYEIWVGSYEEGGYHQSTLRISELGPGNN